MLATDRIKGKFERLLEEGTKILRASGWDGRQHNTHPDDVDYRRFRTEALNLVRIVCGPQSDHYRELSRIAEGEKTATNSYYFKDCFGILQAAKRDFDDDLLFDLRAVVAAEVLGDFIDQAEALLGAGYHIAAASLAGAVLEDAMRKLCAARGLPVPEKTTIDALNADLGRAGIYDKLIHKRILGLADVRNNADHGHFDKISKDDADDMVRYVRRFCADFLVHGGP
jgi:hypothetical protein